MSDDWANKVLPGEPPWLRHAPPWYRARVRRQCVEDLAREEAREEEARQARARYPLYVRFGDPPEGGRSTTYRQAALKRGDVLCSLLIEHELEKGVSAFRARETADGFYECDVSDGPVLGALFLMLKRSGKPAYQLFGREVGRGGSGEPVLEVERFEPVPLSRVRCSGHHGAKARLVLEAMRFVG